MIAFICSFLVAFLPLLASATLTITRPTADGWKGNTTVTVAWNFNATDSTFSIELGNPNIHSGLLAQGPIAVQNNVQPNLGSVSFELPDLPPGNGYFVQFVNVANVNQVYATSVSFPITDNPITTTTTSTTSSRFSTIGSNVTSGSPTGTASSTSISQTSLVLSSTTTASSATSTTKSGGAMASFGFNLSGMIFVTFVVVGAAFGGAL
ncbi:uncharacterized protein EI90DRAFT_3285699 [Cantharellus anzutake]|uniref:uncharacterized protein n=1 Tax=Cantharellus anzutake TaxID=1750568 RepID=UPI0019059C34|nr:uncharacterized protein EI90DRAFT_3285699 [Cantharellus anzutake]KAF8341644.1 hypothetical protein EI90DRAFT_3285699 [Cantharellus anzutake]